MNDYYLRVTNWGHNMKYAKLFVVTMVAVLAGIMASGFAAATPYSGQNVIGDYHQLKSYETFSYAGYGYGYDYAYPARAGGFFGTGTEFITGLRSPVWPQVQPVRYTNYYQNVCGWPCWTGGNGYPRAQASQFRTRGRIGGAFGY